MSGRRCAPPIGATCILTLVASFPGGRRARPDPEAFAEDTVPKREYGRSGPVHLKFACTG